MSVEEILRKMQSQLASYQWSEDPAQAFPLLSLEDPEIRTMLTSKEDRSTQPGEQYVSRAYAIQVPVLTAEGTTSETTEDIRDVARTVHTHLTTPDSTGSFPLTDREFQVWFKNLEGQDDRDTAAYLEQIERTIRSQLGVYDKSVAEFSLANSANYPLYIWSLHANAGGETEMPMLFASSEPAAAPPS